MWVDHKHICGPAQTEPTNFNRHPAVPAALLRRCFGSGSTTGSPKISVVSDRSRKRRRRDTAPVRSASRAARNVVTIKDFVSAIRSLKSPLWRGFLWSTFEPALPRLPGACMRGHAGIQTANTLGQARVPSRNWSPPAPITGRESREKWTNSRGRAHIMGGITHDFGGQNH
eukprot:gene25730-biopygen10540